ncbi:MAG: winged helix-turn-helix domain-containing tetratricopeptide repeat protein [Terriglobales bacterium]
MARSRIYEFSVFRFDTDTGELTRNGWKIRIPNQVSQVLAILLDHAGVLVTREEIRQLLWPEGTFLDYDSAINRAISQLRTVLRDNSRTPKFIETIPKRGYRFVGEIGVQSAVVAKGGTTVCETESCKGADECVEGAVPTPADPAIAPTHPSNAALAQIADTPQRLRRLAIISRLYPFRWRIWVLVTTIAIVLGAIGLVWNTRRKIPPPGYIYVGIAPFEVAGPDAEKLAESFRLDLTDAVAQLPGVQVRAAQAFPRGKGDNANISALAQMLHLDVLLMGDFKIEGKNCDLQFELVRGRDFAHLASFRYSGTKDDLATFRNRIQRELYTRLELTRYASQPAQVRATAPRAYEAYLRARYYLSQQTDESLHKAVEQFGRAVAADASFAKAWAGMAHAHAVMADHGVRRRDDSYHTAKELATRAIQMDASLAEARAVLGWVAFRLEWNFRDAERELRRAVELDPSQASYHIWLAVILCVQGRFHESFEQIDRARAADPFWPSTYLAEAFVASSARQNARMIDAAQALVKMLPEWPLAHLELAWALWYAGRHEEAIAEWRHMALLEHDTARMELEDRGLSAFRRGGVPAYAKIRLDGLSRGAGWAHAENEFVAAEWYAYAGEADRAVAALEDMVAHREPDVLQMAVNPAYVSLHQDSRFLTLLSRVGLSLPSSYPQTVSHD